MKKYLRLAFSFVLGYAGIRMALLSPNEGGDMWKAGLFLLGALILVVSFAAQPFLAKSNRKVRSRQEPQAVPTANAKAGSAFLFDAFKALDELAARGKDVPPTVPGTPENPRPQQFDFDNGKCPYRRDSSKPLGSKENPVVVGVPESSTRLVFSTDRGCWILTDGLGNGWIR